MKMIDFWIQDSKIKGSGGDTECHSHPQYFAIDESSRVYSKIKQFIINNSIIGTTIAIIIAYSTWDFIQSLVGDIIIPGLYFLLIYPFIQHGLVSNIFEPVHKMDISRFMKELLSYLIVIFLVFIIIDFLMKHWEEFAIKPETIPISTSDDIARNESKQNPNITSYQAYNNSIFT